MRRAVALSALGIGRTSPNPPVGCVILDSAGRPVGEGYHQRKGEPHAEVHALAAAGGLAASGTALVTLEPCNHFGRTPPCHQALIDAGIGRVLIAVIDPTSRGSGGAALLRDADIEVEVGVLADEARVILKPWLTALETGRPKVVWVCDVTDGLARQASDELIAHAGLRYQVDAILHADGHVGEGRARGHGPGAFELPPAVPADDPGVALSLLHDGGARTVLLHGGADVVGSFADRGLIDEVSMCLSPSTASHVPSIVDHRALSWPGFEIRSVRALRSGVLVEMSAR